MIDFDLNEIIERETRREAALAAGSMHVPLAMRSAAGPLPDAVSPLDAPELLWPTERAKVPERCPNCGAGRSSFVVSADGFALSKCGEVSCLMCTRTIVRLKDDKTRALFEKPVPVRCDTHGVEHSSLDACPACTRADQQREANRLYRARLREQAKLQPFRPCRICGTRQSRPDRASCRPCGLDRQAERNHRRLAQVMVPGVPMPSRQIRSLLGIRDTSITRIIERARRTGVPIVRVRHGWFVLEKVS
jgi:hypothetical protein